MRTFVAIYHGATARDAKLVSVSTDPDLAAAVAKRLLAVEEKQGEKTSPVSTPINHAIRQGRLRALRLIAMRSGVSH